MSRVPDDLAAVSAQAASAYLTLAGWEHTRRGELGDRWRYIDGLRARNVAVPHDQLEAADRATMLAAVIRVLQEVEDRPSERIAADLRHADSDVVSFRVVAPQLTSGEMPLRAAPEMLTGAVETLTAAARAEDQRRAFYSGGQAPTVVRQFLDDARIGPAEAGSVILSIRSKVEPGTPEQAQTALVPEAERPLAEVPFARRVLRRLISGVRAAKTAAHSDPTALSVDDAFDEAIEEGLSANLCEALTGLATKDAAGQIDAQVSLGIRWALFYPSDEARTTLELAIPELKAMHNIAARLRDIQPIADQHLSGPVRELSREPGEGDGTVRVTADVRGQTAVVRLYLAAEDYDVALRAHRENREIEFSGTLEKAGKIWEVTTPTGVAMRADGASP